MRFPVLRTVAFLAVLAFRASAQEPAPPKLPLLNDPALRLEKFATFPEVEACTTVVGAPDGSVYVGCDPRDTRLNTIQPVCSVVRFSSLGPEKKRTVFAEGLYSPAGSAWHDGWLYVIHDPLMSRFKDTNGDGVADVREDLITDLGMPPGEGLNDHVVSGLTLGMDGFFYLSVGDRGIYQAKGKDGSTVTLRGGGIVRCRPDGTQLEIFSTGTRNHLAVLLDAEDHAFTLDNTDDGNGWWTRLTHHIEGGYYGYPWDYQKAPNYGVAQPSAQTLDAMKRNGHGSQVVSVQSSVFSEQKASDTAPAAPSLTTENRSLNTAFLPAMADFGPGSPTGGLCYLSDGLPEQYRGKLFFSEWGKQNISVVEVARDGATFRFVKSTPLIQSVPGADFRPMQLSVAADGSLLIADWGWGGWKAPKQLGTIWRITWPEAQPAPRLADESKASVEELLAALGHADRDQRLRAQGELVKRALSDVGSPVADVRLRVQGEAVRREVVEIVPPTAASLWIDAHTVVKVRKVMMDGNAALLKRAHAMWSLVEIGREQPQPQSGMSRDVFRVVHAIGNLLKDPNAALRFQAARAESLSRMREVDVLNEPEAFVRLKFAQALWRYAGSDAKFGTLLDDPDPWVRFAARSLLRRSLSWQAPGTTQMAPTAEEVLAPVLSDARKSGEFAWSVLPPSLDAGLINARSDDYLVRMGEATLRILQPLLSAKEASIRARAISALSAIAYQPKPYDGKWWGTQPVKNPAPLNSVAWAGTPAALAALTAALGDADGGVREAAAKAFSGFTLGGQRAVAASADEAAPNQGTDGAVPSKALAAIRARLTVETDAAVRRQLIETLGVQRDPEAMGVFTAIALDEKADAAFRETAINAVVSIGGEAARKTVAQLASAQVSPAATRKIIQAAGELRVVEAAPALLAQLAGDNAGNRQFAAKALGQLGPKANATAALSAALADPDDKVKQAALEALGALRDKAALPALLEFAKTKKNPKELIAALSAMPDPQSIPLLVNALRDNNSGIRRNALKALKTMREAALPPIEEMLASGKIPKEFEPEIRAVFDSGAIVKWKMVGVFENVWAAVHEPEKEALAAFAEVFSIQKPVASDPTAAAALETEHRTLNTAFLTKRYHNAEGHDTGWTDQTADNPDGHLDLAKIYNTTGMVCAYAYAEIESPAAADARLLGGSDDQIAIWLNGEKVHDFAGARGYEPDTDTVPLKLVAGKNALLVKIGNQSGTWEFGVRIPGVDGGKFTPPKDLPPDVRQRHYALAQKPDGTWLHAGDPQKGRKIFHDPNGALGGICAQCHKVGETGGEVGSNLTLVGSLYKRGDLLTSILEPNKTIALGYDQVMVETKGGELFAGAVRKETDDEVTLLGADMQPHAVKKADIKTRTPVETSIMPAGLTLGLKPEDVVDLLAYLESLRGN